MTAYTVDYSYKTENWDSIVVEADNREDAELFAREDILESHPEISSLDLMIDDIKEVK